MYIWLRNTILNAYKGFSQSLFSLCSFEALLLCRDKHNTKTSKRVCDTKFDKAFYVQGMVVHLVEGRLRTERSTVLILVKLEKNFKLNYG